MDALRRFNHEFEPNNEVANLRLRERVLHPARSRSMASGMDS